MKNASTTTTARVKRFFLDSQRISKVAQPAVNDIKTNFENVNVSPYFMNAKPAIIQYAPESLLGVPLNICQKRPKNKTFGIATNISDIFVSKAEKLVLYNITMASMIIIPIVGPQYRS